MMAGKQEAVVRSFLRKISPNRDWDYLGEHEHALIADLVNDIAAMHGTLTAEQVRHAAHGHYKLRMVLDVDSFDVPQVMFDWQAIADELNAELGSGTCELEPLSALDVTLNMLGQIEWGACSECGCAVPMGAKFCNECGKAVTR